MIQRGNPVAVGEEEYKPSNNILEIMFAKFYFAKWTNPLSLTTLSIPSFS